MSLPDYSEPSPENGYYDVFLSFRGPDTRRGFTTTLYHELHRNKIHTFMDVDLTGKEIGELFREMIPKSRMGVVIYSKNYASSRWCLQELEMIMQRTKEKKMLVTPIFYKVNLDDLKDLTGQTAEDLDKHVAKHGETTVQAWRDAVKSFSGVSGLPYKSNDSRSKHDFIKSVIGIIQKLLKREGQQHSVDQSKGVVYSQWSSSSSHQGGQLEGMVADKQSFTYDEILKITNNLDKLIAQSAYGDVYSGKLNGATVAVKILPHSFVQKAVLELGSDVIEKYLILQCSLRHENLVSLLGYCFDHGEKMALVFEFIENGDLRKHLSGASPRVLTWKERVKIAVDIAEGLKYLHGVPVTGDGNLLSTDIVFDENMTAKILFFPSERDHATNPYDRYITSMKADAASLLSEKPSHKEDFSKKLDLHCFARILYELVTGYAPPLTTWQNFANNLSQGNLKVDSRLGEIFDKITVENVIQLAHNCAQLQDITKPPIGDVLEALKAPRLSSSHQGGQPEGMVADKQCFTYDEILKITNNLDKVIAQTQSGLEDVYSGKLNGAAVAVKILPPLLVQGSVSDVGSDSTEQCLRRQCSFRHENLVSLLGYCFDDHGEKTALVFEFIANGDLRKHLSGDSPRVLTWKERVRIATEIAQGLEYLHGMSITSSGNLQSTDIVFDDEKMTAKILLFQCKRSQATNPYDRYITSINADAAASNFLFLSNPLQKVQFNKKLDLHCFARILYELVTGNEAPLTTWQNFVTTLCQGNLQVDWRLGGVVNMITAVNVTQCAYCCALMENFMLPPISVVLETLKAQYMATQYW